MNREDLAKLGAIPKSLHVPYGIKTWGEDKSVGGDWGFDVDLSPEADPEMVGLAVYEYLKQVAHKAMSEDLASVAKPEPVKTEGLVAPKKEGLLPPEAEDEEEKPGTEHIKEIVKFSLEKRTDGKFHLKLFPIIGGGPGMYAHVHFVAERDRMWDMLTPIGPENYNLLELPKEYACEWVAHYKISEKKTSKGGYYKDLLRIEEAH